MHLRNWRSQRSQSYHWNGWT